MACLQYDSATTQYDSSSQVYGGTSVPYNSAAVYDTTSYDYDGCQQGITLNLASTLAPTDSISKGIGVDIPDTLTITDLIAKAMSVGLNEATVSLTEGFGKDATILKEDSLSLTDLPIASRGVSLSINDILGELNLYDDVVEYNSSSVVYDGGTMVDSISTQTTYLRSLSSSITPTDSVLTASEKYKSISDSIGITDTITFTFGFTTRPELFATIVLKSRTSSDNLKSIGSFINIRPDVSSIQQI